MVGACGTNATACMPSSPLSTDANESALALQAQARCTTRTRGEHAGRDAQHCDAHDAEA